MWMDLVAQTTALDPTSGTLERLGVAGIVVVAAFFLLRYFMSQIAVKDATNASLTERFIAVAERFATATEANTRSNESVQEAIQHLSDGFRQTIGDAIVQVTHEARQAAGLVQQQGQSRRFTKST